MDALIQILNKFEMLIAHPTIQDSYIMPSVLPETKPNRAGIVRESTIDLHMERMSRIYGFHFLPYGALSRLLVRFCNQAMQPNTPFTFWKNGVILTEVSMEMLYFNLTEDEPNFSGRSAIDSWHLGQKFCTRIQVQMLLT